MKKLVRILPMVLVIGAMAVIPASTQVLGGATSSDEAVSLPMAILINRLELSTNQMQALKDAIDGLLVERDQMDQTLADFKQEMIAFSGSAEELDARLEEFQAQRAENAQTFQDHLVAAIDEIKATLSMKQGEILAEAFPTLSGTSTALGSGAIRDRLRDRLDGADLPAAMEPMRDRLQARISDEDSASDTPGTTLRQRILGIDEDDAAACVGVMSARRGGRVGFAAGATRGAPMLGWLQQFSQVLELKLNNAQP